MVAIQSKVCSDCGEEKSLENFYSQRKYSKKRGNWIYYNPECKNCTAERAMRWAKENPEKAKRMYKKRNSRPEVIERDKVHKKNYVKSGKRKEWERNNKDKLKQYAENRQHKAHEIPDDEWMSCKQYFDHSCAYCGIDEVEHYHKYDEQLQKDHVDPNGSNKLDNCIPACKSCNPSKGQYNLNEWYNTSNLNYEEGRLIKINKWLNDDYKLFMNN